MTTPSSPERSAAALSAAQAASIASIAASAAVGQRILNDPSESAVSASVGNVFRNAPSTVFVNLGASAAAANIARDGVTVPVLAIDTSRLVAALPNFTLLENRVVAQSVPAGTPVPKGTSIDLVLASPVGLPVGIVPNTHAGLQARSMQALYQQMIASVSTVRAVLARNTAPDTLSTDDRSAIQAVLTQNGVTVDETDPSTSIAAAFTALQAAATFATPTGSVSSATSGFGQLFS